MLITFIGNRRNRVDNRGSVTIDDVDFPLNVPVEVQEKPIFAKLRGNSHFRVKDSPRAGEGAAKTDSGKDDAEAAKRAKADLVAKAESLGVEFDKRWNAQKIQDAIDAHSQA